MAKVLGRKFFERSAPEVAEDLIGKYLIKKFKDSKIERFRITETEAYEGIEDKASHASRGKTKRNEVMFGKAGIFYIYLVYGFHEMLNIVTGKEGHPGAVLIRGIERLKEGKIERLEGPGKVTRELKIGRDLNGLPAVPENNLWFEDGQKINKKNILKTPRVGVSYAGPIWSKKLWRFIWKQIE